MAAILEENHWYRIRNFFDNYKPPGIRKNSEIVWNEVIFKNTMSSCVIKKIIIRNIQNSSKKEFTITMEPSIFFFDKLSYFCNKHFGPYAPTERENRDGVKKILIAFPAPPNPEYSNKLQKMFEEINAHCQSQMISKTLIKDIDSILNHSSKSAHRPILETREHFLNETEGLPKCAFPTQDNPSRKDSKDVLDLLKNKKPSNKIDLLKLLRQGENPNQENESGETPLMLAIVYAGSKKDILSKDIIRILVWYGADPRYRSKKIFTRPLEDFYHEFREYSPLELCRLRQRGDLFEIFMSASSPRKPLTSRLKVMGAPKVWTENGEIRTLIDFANNEGIFDRRITSHLITTERFHSESYTKARKYTKALFKELFNHSDNDPVIREMKVETNIRARV